MAFLPCLGETNIRNFTQIFLYQNRRVLKKAIEVAECLEIQHTNVLLIGKNLMT